jgi:GT2 family glycosyltransferase
VTCRLPVDREEGHVPKMRPDRPAAQADGAPLADAVGDLAAPERADRVDCAVVIVTYNSARDIAGLLDCLPAAAAGLTLRTIVVDNGSADATIDLVRRRADVRCIEAGANLGYAGGINVGRLHAGDYSALLVLNPDLVLEPGSIREMAAVLGDPAIGIVAPMLAGADGHRYPSLRRWLTVRRAIGDGLLGRRFPGRPGWLSEIVRDDESYGCRHAVDWASGAALLISAACDDAVGPWDDGYFLYSEETDYATRAAAAGFRVEYVPTARATHRGGGSGQSSELTALMAVSRLRYVTEHRRWLWPYQAAQVVAELLRSGHPGHRAALKAVLRRSTWPELALRLQNPPPAAGGHLAQPADSQRPRFPLAR